jgi:hypothetical protein
MKDFAESKEDLLKWILSHLNEERKPIAEKLSEGEFSVAYLKYDWSTNTKGQLPTKH